MNIKQALVPAEKILDKFIEKINFGEFVKHIRESDDITQVELAKRLKVSKQFVNSIESMKACVSIEMAKKIADSLNYPYHLFIKILLNDMLKKADIKERVELVKKSA
jgi:transcriptional regulator with XRE-family HTH domain